MGNSEGTIRDKAAAMLRVTTELFYDLADNAARELYYVMREILERWEWGGKNSIIPDKAESNNRYQRLLPYIERIQNGQSINTLEEHMLQLIELLNETSLNTNRSN